MQEYLIPSSSVEGKRNEKDLWWLRSLIFKMMKNSGRLECTPSWHSSLGLLWVSISVLPFPYGNRWDHSQKASRVIACFSDATGDWSLRSLQELFSLAFYLSWFCMCWESSSKFMCDCVWVEGNRWGPVASWPGTKAWQNAGSPLHGLRGLSEPSQYCFVGEANQSLQG